MGERSSKLANVLKDKLLFQHNDGSVVSWSLNGTQIDNQTLFASPGAEWYLRGSGPFYTADTEDYIWQNANTGMVATWQMKDGAPISYNVTATSPDWHVVASGDFYGTGLSGALLQNKDGSVAVWDMDNGVFKSFNYIGLSRDWAVVGAGHFYSGDTSTDVVLENATGGIALWNMDRGAIASFDYMGLTNDWRVKAVADLYGNGDSDVVFEHSDGTFAVWDIKDGGGKPVGPGAA